MSVLKAVCALLGVIALAMPVMAEDHSVGRRGGGMGMMQGALDLAAGSNTAGNDEEDEDEALADLGEGIDQESSSCPVLLHQNQELTKRLSSFEASENGEGRNAEPAVQELGAASGGGDAHEGFFTSLKKKAVQATKAAVSSAKKRATKAVSTATAIANKVASFFPSPFKKQLKGLEVNSTNFDVEFKKWRDNRVKVPPKSVAGDTDWRGNPTPSMKDQIQSTFKKCWKDAGEDGFKRSMCTGPAIDLCSKLAVYNRLKFDLPQTVATEPKSHHCHHCPQEATTQEEVKKWCAGPATTLIRRWYYRPMSDETSDLFKKMKKEDKRKYSSTQEGTCGWIVSQLTGSAKGIKGVSAESVAFEASFAKSPTFFYSMKVMCCNEKSCATAKLCAPSVKKP